MILSTHSVSWWWFDGGEIEWCSTIEVRDFGWMVLYMLNSFLASFVSAEQFWGSPRGVLEKEQKKEKHTYICWRKKWWRKIVVQEGLLFSRPFFVGWTNSPFFVGWTRFPRLKLLILSRDFLLQRVMFCCSINSSFYNLRKKNLEIRNWEKGQKMTYSKNYRNCYKLKKY